ncbi:cytochrome b5 reductase, partial [Caulochytrium protostelioides]
RSYTPVSANWDRGYFDLLIKTYPQGNVSLYVRDMKIGDKLQVKGPKGQFVYRPNRVRVFGMIAGGTGITPMYQIMRAVLNNPEDRSTIQLIFANVALEDILLKDELDALAKEHPDRVKVTYCLNTPPTPAENNGHPWEGYTGFVTEEMIRKHLPAPASDIQILMCGP